MSHSNVRLGISLSGFFLFVVAFIVIRGRLGILQAARAVTAWAAMTNTSEASSLAECLKLRASRKTAAVKGSPFSPFFALQWSLLVFCCLPSLGAPPAAPESAPAVFRFKFPLPREYRAEGSEALRSSSTNKLIWLKARAAVENTNLVEFGSRIVLQVRSTNALNQLLGDHPLSVVRVIAPGLVMLQAPDALTAARQAHWLASQTNVAACYPVSRQRIDLHGRYAPQPTDTFFSYTVPSNPYEWALENRNVDGSSAGMDLNLRAAWTFSVGAGVTVAVADSGLEMAHPELAAQVAGAPHYNFSAQSTDVGPVTANQFGAHGTEVAGLLAADLNHARMVGAAPGARLASWVIMDTNLFLATDDQLMDMYQYASNVVGVQNHSWGHQGLTQVPAGLLEAVGISNAVTFGRFGRGTIMVRSAGNDRAQGANANDEGYLADPRVIGVAGVRKDGRVASYSEPGACLLVGAPSGEIGADGLFTTDLLGTAGVNQINFFPPFEDMNGYVWGALGFQGTSAAAALISGLAALMISANTNLTYRDVQQILLLSARHFDYADPDLVTNGAGFLVSHNAGFGVPDAGEALRLARKWPPRPPAQEISFTSTDPAAIPDDGLRVLVSGPGIPDELASIHCLPSVGPHADSPTAQLPLVDCGYGTNFTGLDLTNKAALIQRGAATFAPLIDGAAQAGAAFAIIYNYETNSTGSGAPGGDQLVPMGATDFVPIPAVFIGYHDGLGLQSLFLTNQDARAQLHLDTTNYVFAVTNTLICEHVGVRVTTDHPLRGDLRITLVSPSGTRSVLQRYNADVSPGPIDWTYYSTHHFFEPTVGTWTVCFSDEGAGMTGNVQSVTLLLRGVPIRDADGDGLDDAWETKYFGSIQTFGPNDDPDQDGYSNMREQIMDTDPTVGNDLPLRVDLSPWNDTLARLSWASSPHFSYEIWSGTNAASLQYVTTVPGRFSETEWFTSYHDQSALFFQVRRK